MRTHLHTARIVVRIIEFIARAVFRLVDNILSSSLYTVL